MYIIKGQSKQVLAGKNEMVEGKPKLRNSNQPWELFEAKRHKQSLIMERSDLKGVQINQGKRESIREKVGNL